MDLWTDHMKEKNGQNIHKRLSVIGATRWGSKHDALQKFFGTFRDGEGALYTDVVQVLEIAVSSTKLSVEARYDAQCLLTSLLKYKDCTDGICISKNNGVNHTTVQIPTDVWIEFHKGV